MRVGQVSSTENASKPLETTKRSKQIKQNKFKSNQIKSNQIKSNQIKSNQIKSRPIQIKSAGGQFDLIWLDLSFGPTYPY